MRSILVLACLLGLSSSAYAQTPTVPPNTPFQATADHADGASTPATGFRCYVDNAKVGNDLPLSARVAGKVSCAMPGQPIGNHSLQIAAFNAFGEARTPGLAFTVGGPPSAPTNLQIVLQIAVAPDGSGTLTAINVTKTP